VQKSENKIQTKNLHPREATLVAVTKNSDSYVIKRRSV